MRNQYGQEVGNVLSLKPEARDGIVVLENERNKFRFWFDVRVQADGAVFFGEEDWMDPIGNNASIRRARIGIKSQLSEHWGGEIDTDFANGAFEIKDALLRYNNGRFGVKAGNFKEDFSMEMTTTSRYLPMMERPMVVQTFAPSRHIGANVTWRRNWLYLSGGVHFQALEGQEAATWIEDAEKDQGYNQGMSYTGKMVLNPLWNKDGYGVHLGGGLSYRTPKTDIDPREYGGFRYSSRNATNINRKKYLDTDRHPGVTDHELLWNAELAAHYKGFRFQGEYISMTNHLKKNLGGDYAGIKSYNFGGWYAMASYLLFGGEQRYNLGESEFTQPSRGREWGDVELVARYDYMDLNDRNVYGGSGENYTFGVNYYVNSNVKFVLNYQYTKNDRYANSKGDHFVGLDTAGNPTKDPTKVDMPKGKAGVRYQMLGLRMEVDF
jgi:phosphate-selective porin OprO/OprP